MHETSIAELVFRFDNFTKQSSKLNIKTNQLKQNADQLKYDVDQLTHDQDILNHELDEINELIRKVQNDLMNSKMPKPPEVSNFMNKLPRASVKDLFFNEEEGNQNSLADLTNSTVNNQTKKIGQKTVTKAKNLIKESPLKSVFPQYFYKTPIKESPFKTNHNSRIEENSENSAEKKQSVFAKKKKPNIRKSSDSSNNDIPSPKKTFQKPKLKQLTMTQAFTSQLNSPKKTNQSTVLMKDISQIKPSTIYYQQNFVKSEPISQTLTTNFNNISNFVSPKVDPNETCLPADYFVKNEPMDDEMISNESKSILTSPNKEVQKYNVIQNEYDQEYFKDFDRVPKKKSDSPNYKHVKVVRKQEERKKLGTSTCKECENYWNSLPEDKRPSRMEEMCRHRAKYQAPATPEHYWEVEFPSREECLERGYGGVITQNDRDNPIEQRPRRKRPLRLKEIEKEELNEDMSDLDFDRENY